MVKPANLPNTQDYSPETARKSDLGIQKLLRGKFSECQNLCLAAKMDLVLISGQAVVNSLSIKYEVKVTSNSLMNRNRILQKYNI